MNQEYNYAALAQEVMNQHINLAESFEDWTKLAFSLSNLGEAGRPMFHAIASLSAKYKYKESDRKFTDCLNKNRKTDISTFVWMCKNAGVDTNQFYTKEGDAPVTIKVQPRIQQEKAIHSIPFRYVEASASYNNDLVFFLCRYFDEQTLERIMEDYAIGSTKDKQVIFWQIDQQGRVRTGKIMGYDPTNGHRIKEGANRINWIHCLLKKKGVLSAEWELNQCLFGLHLLTMYPEKPCAIVESEKSALIGSAVFPDYVWLATGGKEGLGLEKMQPLKGRTCIMFPDADGVDYWKAKADDLQRIGCRVIVSDFIQENAVTPKDDIADLLIRQLESDLKKRTTPTKEQLLLAEFKEQNPAVCFLESALDLTITSTSI